MKRTNSTLAFTPRLVALQARPAAKEAALVASKVLGATKESRN